MKRRTLRKFPPGDIALVWTALAILSLGRSGFSSPLDSEIYFEDLAGLGGVDVIVDNSETPDRFQIEPMIAGVALFDFNNDGLLDLYVANGASIPGLQKSGPEFRNRLYRNRGEFRFEDVTDVAGVSGEGYSMGVATGDYDNDGWVDLYLTGVNVNTLYRNLGSGRFADVTDEAGVEGFLEGYGKAWSVGAGWFDFDRDGDLDLLVVNYCVWSIDKDSRCGAPLPGYRTYCHPDLYAPLPNILYRNNGDGTFDDVSRDSGIGQHLGKGMGLAFADYDRDGWLDVFVSNDAWRNFLFRNNGDGTFEEQALEAGVGYIDSAREVSGMGADFRDYDGDLLPDIFMTALSNETFPIFRNLGSGLFRDERFRSGLGVSSLPWSGWSVGMVDLDNDGFLDLFTAGGHVQTNEELYTGRSSLQSNRVFRNLGDGRFEDVTETCGEDFQQRGLHRGASFGDIDNDGRVDAVVTRLNDKLELFANRTKRAGHFLVVLLEGARANRDGMGAEIHLELGSGRKLVRTAGTAAGYGGSIDKRVHFGLGKETAIESLTVTWPGGKRQVLEGIEADQFLHIREMEVGK